MLNRTLSSALVPALIVCCSAVCAQGQSLQHEKYQLPNGMTVILHEDHSLPVAGVNIWYRVGARNEPKGRSGFAHLFEHLMFMGTRRVPGSDFDNLMEAGGGSNNASTALDRTNYYSSGPSSILPLLLWLDADRLEDLGVNMTKEKVDLQRDVVRNELRQSVENAPYARAYEASYQIMYPEGHPYHTGVIGTHQDLEAATTDDVKNFFATFYAPENASLVVAGDFKSVEIKPLIERLFGSIPRGNSPAPRLADPVKMTGVVRRSMIDKVQLPKIAYAFHSPGSYAEGDAEMNLAGAILSEGKNSRLYKRLVMDDKTAVSVSAQQDQAALGSLFRVEVMTRPDADLAAVEKALDEELAKFASQGPTAEELKQRASTVELSLLSSLQSVMARADKLNEYQYYLGQPDSLQRDLDRYRKATPDGVKAVAKRVLTPDARLIMRVLPEEPDRPETGPREKRPADSAANEFTPPLPAKVELSNKIPVYVWTRKDLPLVTAELLIDPAGPVDEPGKAGLAGLAAAMTQEGAGDRDAAAFAQALQSLGATMGAGVDYDSVALTLSTLSRNFDAAAGLMADAALRPRMQEADWDRVKRIHLDDLKQQDEEPAIVAPRVASRMLMSDGNPYGLSLDGTEKTVSTLTLADVKQAHQRLFSGAGARLLVAGDITPEQAKSALEKAFGKWAPTGSSSAPKAQLGFRSGDKMRVYIVDRPGAVQTMLHFAAPGPKFSDPARVDLELANIIVGGSFTSRLNRNLREVHGYTYGARSRVGARRDLGTIRAYSAVRADVTGLALKEFLSELKRAASGDISAEEVQKARETYGNDTAESFGRLGGIVADAAELLIAGAPLDTTAADLKAALKAGVEGLNRAASANISLDRGVLVMVGDKKLILTQIKDLGLPMPIEVDEQGDPVPAGQTHG